MNITDPDCKTIPDGLAFVQGNNVQAAVNEQQIVLAAEITNTSTDFSLLGPMVGTTIDELQRAGIDQMPEPAAANAGYWNEHHIDEVVAHKHIPVLIPGQGQPRYPAQDMDRGRSEWMRTVLKAEHGGQHYRKRRHTVEPLFGNTKHSKGVTRFLRRGSVRVRTEWRLQIMSHNITKLHRHQLAVARA